MNARKWSANETLLAIHEFCLFLIGVAVCFKTITVLLDIVTH